MKMKVEVCEGSEMRAKCVYNVRKRNEEKSFYVHSHSNETTANNE